MCHFFQYRRLFPIGLCLLVGCGKSPELSLEEPPARQISSSTPQPAPPDKTQEQRVSSSAGSKKKQAKMDQLLRSIQSRSEKKLTARSDTSGKRALLREIDENNRRIAKLQAELAE